MKVKLDENMPVGLVSILKRYGYDAVTVPQQGLTGQSDATIWEAAQRESRFLITMDLDFADIRRFSPGTHQGILILRLSKIKSAVAAWREKRALVAIIFPWSGRNGTDTHLHSH